MYFKPIKVFFDSKNKYRYFYNTINATTIFLLIFVFINQYHSFIDVKTINTYMFLAQMIDKINIQILFPFILLKKSVQFIIHRIDKNNSKIFLLAIDDLVDIFIRVLVMMELASMLIISLNKFNYIFYIMVIAYYWYLLLKALLAFNRKIVILSDKSISYFDNNYKRLHLDDYVIYQGCLYEIKKINDIYYICRNKDRLGVGYKENIPLEEALKNVDGKLKFHQHG